MRSRLAVGRVIVYKSSGGWIRQGDPSLRTPLLNRAIVEGVSLHHNTKIMGPSSHSIEKKRERLRRGKRTKTKKKNNGEKGLSKNH